MFFFGMFLGYIIYKSINYNFLYNYLKKTNYFALFIIAIILRLFFYSFELNTSAKENSSFIGIILGVSIGWKYIKNLEKKKKKNFL